MYKVRIVKCDYRRYKLYVDGILVTIKEMAERVGLHVATIQAALVHGEEQRVVNWLVREKAGVRKGCRVYWNKCECLFLDDVIEQVGINNAAASIRARRWSEDGDNDILYRPKGASIKMLKARRPMHDRRQIKNGKVYTTTVVSKKKPFNRTKFCLRDKGQEKCRHYYDCCEYRMRNGNNAKSKWYKADGKCYDGVAVKGAGSGAAGQWTDRLRATTNYV